MENDKVFGSEITRPYSVLENNLYDILKVEPAIPLFINKSNNLSCDFAPKTDKYFVPKKKIRLKVKTVRDIRNLFENDIYSTLEHDLEKQQNMLFRKIRVGSSKDEKTRLLATNMLKGEKPISRVAWQMVINVNPNNHAHASQYVLWNGKYIQVNGSRGGKNKFICKYDLGSRRASLLHSNQLRKPNFSRMKGLLRNSLNVKFKPGPLSRKKYLDMSYQKYNFGRIELTELPNPGLDVTPEYGKPLELSITNYLNALRDESGLISDKWAEFAVSTVGKEENGCAVQINKDRCVTFDLKYKYEQRLLLMRRCDDFYNYERSEINSIQNQILSKSYTDIDMQEEKLTHEVSAILHDMLASIEISLLQNDMYTGEDPPRDVDTNDLNTSTNGTLREKFKKNGELNRLDVTVIRLSDTKEKNCIKGCSKSFCKLGCICESLFSPLHLKRHCGRVECMFDCKCDFTKYNLYKVFEDEIVPGLVNLDKENNLKLSKEEQKFHQTVVLSGDKSILLKSQKRNWKAPKRYADFYSSMCLKTKKEAERVLSIVELKFNCANIEPWCMVHNLYKCFCKGKFTEKFYQAPDAGKTLEDNSKTKILLTENQTENLSGENNKPIYKSILRPRVHKQTIVCAESHSKDTFCPPSDHQVIKEHCARTKAYKGRKYSNIHYINANKKILEMEQNDTRLRKRMNHILNIEEPITKKKVRKELKDVSISDICLPKVKENERPVVMDSSVPNENSNNTQTCNTLNNEFLSEIELSQRKIGSQSWLKSVIKTYSMWFNKGLVKKSLDPPKDGKMALYPWEFIAERYRNSKNYFLVTNYKPYRIFMAVHRTNALFQNCIDIKTIVDVENYPLSIRALVKNENDRLKNHLCILRGLDFCWELVGCVEKLREVIKDKINHPAELSKDDEGISPGTSDSSISLPDPVEHNKEQSKWFVMTLENDFTEIQFYNRGFFVTYDAIIKAIKVARVSDKTVRLSSQKCPDGNGGPQFGIYAIPNANEYCVFIGPYDKNEPLGIESVKSNLYFGKKRTRGVWFTTNKIDNLKVIDNPLSFMSQINSNNEEILVDSSQEIANTDSESITINKNDNKISPTTHIKILPKPIKITKTNNFYHLTNSGLLKTVPVSPEKYNLKLKSPILLSRCAPFNVNTAVTKFPFQKLTKSTAVLFTENKKIENPMTSKPIAEIAPQVKVLNDCDQSNIVQHKAVNRKLKGGMSILKPEEINQRSLENKINMSRRSSNKNSTNLMNDDNDNDNIDMDIQNFLSNTIECSAPNADVFVISDDEGDSIINANSKTKLWKDVGVVCKNIENIGWIPGRQNKIKHLSFEFPGFDYTEFYPEEEALEKINKVLSRKINIPRHLLELKWSVKEIEDLKDKQKLKPEDLGSDFVLSKQGPIHEFDLAERVKKKECSDNLSPKSCVLASTSKIKEEPVGKNIIMELESVSNLLDEETDRLFGKLHEGNPTKFFEISNTARQQMSERLRTIISNANNS